MSNCTPCTPANDELPIFCDPFPATDTAKRLLVEDEAFCQKALSIPTTTNQILKTNASGNIQWGTLNSVLQSGPVDLGSQPLTTTGSIYCKLLDVTNASGSAAIEVGGSTNSYIDLKNPSSDDFDVRLGTIGGTSGTLETGNNQPLAIYAGSGNVNIQPFGNGRVGIGTSSPQSLLHLTGTAGQQNVVTLLNTANAVGEQGMRVAFDANPARLTIQRASDAGAFEENYVSVMQDTGNVGIGTTSPTNKLVVVGGIDTQHINVANTTGAAYIEVGGVGNAYIDLKVPNPDDNDIRIGTTGNGGYFSTGGNGDITLSPGGTGNVLITNLKTYANNAAAVAGGLAVNTVYKTATGELRVVV